MWWKQKQGAHIEFFASIQLYALMLFSKSIALLILCASVPSVAFSSEPVNPAAELFSFLVNENYKTRLGTQPKLMEKWLSPQLVTTAKIVECEADKASKEEPQPVIDISAGIFFDRWDTPSQCKVSEPITTQGRLVSTVECRWGKGQDEPEGTTIQLFAELASFNGTLKVTNVKHGRQVGNTKTDLIARMRQGTKQSSQPEYCKRLYSK